MGETTTENCAKAEELLEKLRQARIAYRPNAKMIKGRPEQIELAIEPRPGEDPAQSLGDGEGEPVIATTRFARRMAAQLSGASFEITPPGLQETTILRNNPSLWRWTVTPKSEGAHTLNLDLFVIFEINGKKTDPIRVKTFATKIEVDVTARQFLEGFMDNGKMLLGFLTLLGSLVTALGVPKLLAWMKKRGWTLKSLLSAGRPPA